jgi:hypothetical protein
MKTGSNLAESSNEDYGSKRADLPVMTMIAFHPSLCIPSGFFLVS